MEPDLRDLGGAVMNCKGCGNPVLTDVATRAENLKGGTVYCMVGACPPKER